MLKHCPRCGYERQVYDTHVMQGICPECGIAIQKWLRREETEVEIHRTGPDRRKEAGSWFATFKAALLDTPDVVEPRVFYGRLAIYFTFFVWGWSFIIGGMSWSNIGSSFLHNVNLPFHEFGHVLFFPFGRFMTYLGGSLFQVALPLGLGAVFLLRYCDNFAASIMIWWSGQNLIDISPYIADASLRTIPLIRGLGREAHDWGNILTELGWLSYDYHLGRASFVIGALLIVVANIWGGCLLYKQKRHLK